jgi:Bacterial Ig-like domain (group 3)/FG-GAP-like repeat
VSIGARTALILSKSCVKFRRDSLPIAAIVWLACLACTASFAQMQTKTLLTISSPDGVSGSVFSISATVSSSGVPVTAGTVTFIDTYDHASQTLGTIALQSSSGTPGLAMLRTQLGGAGTHTIAATFNATSTLASSSSSETVLLTVAVGVSATPTDSTGGYLLTGTISGFSSSVVPTGTVSFVDSTAGTTLIAGQSLDLSTLEAPIRTNIFPIPSKLYPLVGLQVGKGMAAPAFGDFNGDGKLDIAVPNDETYAKAGQILLGNGDGTFSPGVSLSSVDPSAVVVGDFNRDGFQDVAIVNTGSIGSVDVYLGKGDGTFQVVKKYAVSYTSDYRFIAIGDFNRDGKQDLVITDHNKGVTVLLGNGDGTFQVSDPIPTGNTIGNLVVGDVNSDGFEDLLVADNGDNHVTLLLGNGDGTFRQGTYPTVPGDQSGTVALGDYNGDGKPDLLVSDQATKSVYLFLGNGDGTFQPPITLTTTGFPYYVTVGDFDHDGNLDILVVDDVEPAGMYMEIWLGHGDGTFDLPSAYATGGISIYAIVGDINGDGMEDVVTSVNGSPLSTEPVGLALTLSTVSISTQPVAVTIHGCGSQMVNATYSGDANYPMSSGPSVSLNTSPLPTSVSLTANPSSSTYGQQVTLTAVVSPFQYGSIVTDGDIVTFMNGTATLQSAPLESGIATISLTSLPLGTNSLTAVFAGDCTFSGSSSSTINFTVISQTPPSDFNFQVTSASTISGVYGSSGQFTFLLSPSPGTTMYPGTVQLSINGSGGPLLAIYTISPTSVAMSGGPTSVLLNVSTRKLAQLETLPGSSGMEKVAFALLLVPVCATRRYSKSRLRLTRWAATVLILSGLTSLCGCGSGYFDHLYPIVVTAASNGVQHSITVDYHILKSPQ